MVTRLLAAIVTLAALGSTPVEAAPRVEACPAAAPVIGPIDAGPTRRAGVFCVAGDSPRSAGGIRLAPDGRRLFALREHSGLYVGALPPSDAMIEAAFEPGFGFGPAAAEPFAWASDSLSILGVRQKRHPRGAWAQEPLQPIRIFHDGRMALLPSLDRTVGDLDGVLWVGGDGLALAQFGSRGGLYRPQRANPEPTLAFADLARGKVLETTPFSALAAYRREPSADAAFAAITDVSAVEAPLGKLTAVIRFRSRDWVVWEQGHLPRAMSLGYERETLGLALTPAGDRLLVSTFLQPAGVICERSPACPDPRPTSGVVAALHDLRTGRLLWSVPGTAERFTAYPAPAVSPDGRFAIVGVPASDPFPRAALISLKDGKVLQTFRAPTGSAYTVGFNGRGRGFWMSAGGLVVLYEIGR